MALIGSLAVVCLLLALGYEAFTIVFEGDGFDVKRVLGSTLLLGTVMAIGPPAREAIRSKLFLFALRAVALAVVLGVVVAWLYSGHPSEIALWSSPLAAALFMLFDRFNWFEEDEARTASPP